MILSAPPSPAELKQALTEALDENRCLKASLDRAQSRATELERRLALSEGVHRTVLARIVNARRAGSS